MSTPDIQQYLRRLRAGLGSLPADERDEIVAELRSHIEERVAQGQRSVLDDLGSPEDYATSFVAEHALSGALARGTSFALGRALLTGLRESFFGMLVVPLLALQLAAATLVVVGALKPILPSRIGVFLDALDHVHAIGLLVGDLGGLHEVLGGWAILAFIGPGVLLLWAGNRALRALARARLILARRQAR